MGSRVLKRPSFETSSPLESSTCMKSRAGVESHASLPAAEAIGFPALELRGQREKDIVATGIAAQ